MVAKLSNRCFRLVIQIPERLNLRATQSDFIDLYGKSEDKQYELLCDLLAGRISFQDLKRRRVSFFLGLFFFVCDIVKPISGLNRSFLLIYSV